MAIFNQTKITKQGHELLAEVLSGKCQLRPDPDLGLILFAYTNAGDTADYIGPFNGVFLTEEQFTMRIYTANVAEISATIKNNVFCHLNYLQQHILRAGRRQYTGRHRRTV